MNRRDFLFYSTLFFSAVLAPRPLYSVPRAPRRGKVRSLVFLHMVGGPSQIELFDYKPELIKRDGMKIGGFTSEKGQVGGRLMKPISTFAQHGQSGRWVSDLLPNLTEHVDDLCFIKTLNCTALDHYLAQLEMFTGSITPGNPAVSAWLNYALGPSTRDLPQSVIMTDPLGEPRIGADAWSSLDLPNAYSKLQFSVLSDFEKRLSGLSYVQNGEDELFLRYLNEMNSLGSVPKEKDLGRSELFSLVYRSRRALLDIFKRLPAHYSEDRKKLYGVSVRGENHFADQLMFARELVKAEVPYIQICCGDEQDPTSWDHHFKIADIRPMSKKIDRPIHGFLSELKREGLLDQTLVVWAGEFGRLPMIDEAGDEPDKPFIGRGHNNQANTIWLAGAGVKKGFSLGETDEIGLRSVKDAVQVGDLWATLLHLMGIDHRELQHVSHGTERRFTRKNNRIISEILT